MDQVVDRFATIVGSRISAEVVTSTVSFLSILRCRGGLLLVFILKVNLLRAIPPIIVGNIFPIPLVLLFIRHILNFMRRFSVMRLFIEWLEKHAKNKSAGPKCGEFWGLLFFVGIPLPGTGSWIGALVASLMEVDFKKVMLAVSPGVLLVIFIMAIVSYGLLGISFHREAETSGAMPRLVSSSLSVYNRLNLFLRADKRLEGVGIIDIRFLWENPEAVKRNIREKFQEQKFLLVDEVIALDEESRKTQVETNQLRSGRSKISKSIGALMGQDKKNEAEKVKEEVAKINERLAVLEPREAEITARIRGITLTIPQIMDPSAPISKGDSYNVEIQCYGESVAPNFEIPYHTNIMERLHGIDLEAAGKVAGNGFYYLLGDIVRLHSAVLSYARDFMIDRGLTYATPPYMIHSDVMTGVMSFPEMDAMMHKVEGEDLYLIGMSERSMVGRFIDSMNDEAKLPYMLTPYSPCFHKEKGIYGIEEHGVYRIHQFKKQEMTVICRPEESVDWCNKLWQNIADFFRSLDIPIRTLECCSGDLVDLRVENCDVETWSSRRKKYFEVGSCSNLGDTQACRLRIRVKGADGKKYLAHILNDTCVIPSRMLIAFPENNLQADGSVRIPETLRSYMGGKSELRA